jgi:cytochrome o ubiquinol oxidase subunit I
MVAAGSVGAFATFVVFAWRDEDEEVIPADEVARIERGNQGRPQAMLGDGATAR